MPREGAIDPATGLPRPPTAGSTAVINPATGLPDNPDDTLRNVLDEARELTGKRRYEEALQRFIWHHNHAREYGTSTSALSGLRDWDELGRRYPKARQAMIEIRDRATREFLKDRGPSELIQEIASLNGELQNDDATVALFKTIQNQDKQLAQQCFGMVEVLLVQMGEYDLCLDYVGDPLATFERIRQSWERTKKMEDSMAESQRQSSKRFQEMAKTNAMFSAVSHSPSELPKFADNNFVRQVRQLVEILIGAGHKPDAEKIRDQAVAVLDDARLKSALEDAEQRIHK